jgi:MFS family permease
MPTTERELPFARKAFFLLFTVNLFNYINRYVLPAVFPLIQAELHLTDTQLGLLPSAFMIIYMLFAPLAGFFGDKWRRPRLMGVTTVLWSAATSLAGLADGFVSLTVARSMMGIGEAGFVTIAQSYVAELFDISKRARIMALFTLVIPAGSAIGYIAGGILGNAFGWRAAFMIAGIPGILLGLATLFLPEPREQRAVADAAPSMLDYAGLLKNKVFLAASFTQAVATFAIGGLSSWMPTYFVRYFGYTVARAGMVFGGMTVIAGMAGTWLGGWLGDKILARSRRAYFTVACISLALAAPCAVLSVLVHDRQASLALLFTAEMFVFMHGGPMNAAIVNRTGRNIRSMAFAANIFIIHAFGDAISPFIIGWISDCGGLRLAVAVCALVLIPAALIAHIGGTFENNLSPAI